MRLWYSGYRFEENAEPVYNPVSVNMFFDQREFKIFWFATGTPTFLINPFEGGRPVWFQTDPSKRTKLRHLWPGGFESVWPFISNWIPHHQIQRPIWFIRVGLSQLWSSKLHVGLFAGSLQRRAKRRCIAFGNQNIEGWFVEEMAWMHFLIFVFSYNLYYVK